MKDIIIHIIELLHLLVVIVLSVGGYFVPSRYIAFYLLFFPLLVIDWNDGDGLCWLTKLRNIVKYESMNPVVDDEIENNFVNGLIRKIGIIIEPDTVTSILYLFFCLSWLYAFLRLIKNHNIKLYPNQMTRYMIYAMLIGWFIITMPGLKKTK